MPDDDKKNPTALAVNQSHAAAASPAHELSVAEVVARIQKVKQIKEAVMHEGVHYGVIPGTERTKQVRDPETGTWSTVNDSKPTLYQPGADVLCMAFMFDPQYEHETRYDGEHREITTKCTLWHIPTGVRVASGEGSCSTRESKYAWRPGGVICPKCNVEAIKRGRDYNNKSVHQWYCDKKIGGCGEKFPITEAKITSQKPQRRANPDIADVYNTVLKISNKRARMAAVLPATGGNELFTADLDDYDDPNLATGGNGDGGDDGGPPQGDQQRNPNPPKASAKATGTATGGQQQQTTNKPAGGNAAPASADGNKLIRDLPGDDKTLALKKIFDPWREKFPGVDPELKAPLIAFCRDVLGYAITGSNEIRVSDVDKIAGVIRSGGTWNDAQTGEVHRFISSAALKAEAAQQSNATPTGVDIDPDLPSDVKQADTSGTDQGGDDGDGL